VTNPAHANSKNEVFNGMLVRSIHV